ncbi:hypothetical protein C8J57DRAFT_1243548 [Mycena rebaudengoi]|nr:hypothetical protein C8J57DRAFT_1243548 [Mycena rebaudengoi]
MSDDGLTRPKELGDGDIQGPALRLSRREVRENDPREQDSAQLYTFSDATGEGRGRRGCCGGQSENGKDGRERDLKRPAARGDSERAGGQGVAFPPEIQRHHGILYEGCGGGCYEIGLRRRRERPGDMRGADGRHRMAVMPDAGHYGDESPRSTSRGGKALQHAPGVDGDAVVVSDATRVHPTPRGHTREARIEFVRSASRTNIDQARKRTGRSVSQRWLLARAIGSACATVCAHSPASPAPPGDAIRSAAVDAKPDLIDTRDPARAKTPWHGGMQGVRARWRRVVVKAPPSTPDPPPQIHALVAPGTCADDALMWRRQGVDVMRDAKGLKLLSCDQEESARGRAIHAICWTHGVGTRSRRPSPRSRRQGVGAEGAAARGCAAPPPPPHMARMADVDLPFMREAGRRCRVYEQSYKEVAALQRAPPS